MSTKAPRTPAPTLASRLRAAGLRATSARLAILAELATDGRHPSAEMLHAALKPRHPTLSLSTVYATLESFVRRGLVRRVSAAAGRLRVDGTVADHDHAVCRGCGDVFDVPRDVLERPEPPPQLPSGLRVMQLHLEYEVVCPDCATAGAVARPSASK